MNPAFAQLLRKLGLYHPLHDRRRDRRFRAAGRQRIRDWTAAGKPPPPPDLIKYGVIRDLARRHGCAILVETGTFYGNCIFTLRGDFREIHSIELAPGLYHEARLALAHLPHLHLHLGDSARVLPVVAAGLTAPTLYWLDGHFCAGPSARANQDTPIAAELLWLLGRPSGRDVVLIDDARLFTGKDDYPTVDEIRQLVARHRPAATCEVETDIIRIHPV